MAEVNIGQNQVEVLVVCIGSGEYKVPLAGSIPYVKLKKLKTDDDMIAFFEEYIPSEVFETLLVKDIQALIKAWNDATKESEGATPGES